VDDLVEGLVRLMNTEGLFEPINLGNPAEFTIKQLAQEVKTLCGSTNEIRHEPLPADDPRQRRPDITRAQQLLGWTPEIALRQGLELTIADFANRMRVTGCAV
jgi:UDP-glucuronate decarboxylase